MLSASSLRVSEGNYLKNAKCENDSYPTPTHISCNDKFTINCLRTIFKSALYRIIAASPHHPRSHFYDVTSKRTISQPYETELLRFSGVFEYVMEMTVIL